MEAAEELEQQQQQQKQQQMQPQFMVGAIGQEKIKRMMSAGKPNQVIAEFSASNCLSIPAAGTIYGLLDSLGCTRWSIHDAVLEATVHAAQGKIQNEELPIDKHRELLYQIAPYLGVKRLQKLPLELMAKQPKMIPPEIRQAVEASPELYAECSIGVKRELWRHNNALFRQHMQPLIERYTSDADLASMSREMMGSSVRAHARKRRESSALGNIVRAIDDDLQLYMLTLGMIRERYLENNDSALGTLRLDIVMSMHERDVAEIVSNDVCYRLAWPLDACILRQLMDEGRKKELQAYFDELEPELTPYGEIGLMLSSPYARHIVAQYIVSILEEIAPNSENSALYPALDWPSQMLTIGLSAHDLVETGKSKLPKSDRQARRKFYLLLIGLLDVSLGRDRAFRAGRQGAGGAERRLSPGDVQPALDFLEKSELAWQVVYVFLLKRIAVSDVEMVDLWLPVLCKGLAVFLGAPEDAKPAPAGDRREQTGGAPAPRPIDLKLRPFALEVDAFVQSLVTCIRETRGVGVAVLNRIASDVDQGGALADVSSGLLASPLVRLLDQVARIRHCAHEQTIAFLAHCSQLLSAECSSSSSAKETLAATNGDGAVHSSSSLTNKECVVYFIFVLTEHAASHFAVDPDQTKTLRVQYERLAAASPEQAFRYRICASNCPSAARFLK
ncbi:hypothetical protein GGI07_004134 [Coemansia sp. Benny D115]|nr:hypothetical protein GGI07_004134 [Coemansia sp. Benny D115]